MQGAVVERGACHFLSLCFKGLSHVAESQHRPLVSLIAGILILVMPRLLSTIVALYLIVIGVLGLLGMHTLRF